MSGGESEEIGIDGLHAQAAHRSQRDAEAQGAVADCGQSANLILRQLLRFAFRTDSNMILQDVTSSVNGKFSFRLLRRPSFHEILRSLCRSAGAMYSIRNRLFPPNDTPEI